MTRLQLVGEYLRFGAGLSPHLTELVILIVARRWDQDYEWGHHVPLARAAGLGEDVITAIRDGGTITGPDDVQAVWRMVARGNEYVDRQAPWKQAKDPSQSAALDETLASLIRQLARFAVLLYPYLPEKSALLWQQVGGPGELSDQRFASLMSMDCAGWRVTKGAGLFPKDNGKIEV